MRRIFLFALLLGLFSLSVHLISKDVWNSTSLLSEGTHLFDQKKYKEALLKFNQAIQEDDENSQAYSWRGLSLYELKDFKGAIDSFLKSVAIDPNQPNAYGWISYIYEQLGDKENAQKYRELANNPPKKQIKTLELEDLQEDYHKELVSVFNFFQEKIGNPPAKLDMRLNNAAKKHGEYLFMNHFDESPNLQWHYEEKGKPGFIGKEPVDQAMAFGFVPSKGYFVGNTMGDISSNDFVSTPSFMISHLVSTIYHRNIVIGAGFEAIGCYRMQKNGYSMLVLFYSFLHEPEEDRTVYFPLSGQTGVPLVMMPEIPDPFPDDSSVGFPITVQWFTKDYSNIPVLVSASLKDSKGRAVPFYTLGPNSLGQAGVVMKAYKMIAIAAKDPLSPKTTYTVSMKIKNNKGIFFDKTWSFTTGSGEY